MIRVAVDGMGGDFAPQEIVKGAALAARERELEIILVGPENALGIELKKNRAPKNISLFPATEVIDMNEPPLQALKQKKDASVTVAVDLVRRGKAEAVVSAGNTGAFMAAALFGLGRIEGIERPAIAAIFPTVRESEVLLLDMGANVDCKPRQLLQFAMMGNLYARRVMHIPSPRIGLLNIGEEEEKGNELTAAAYPLLKGADLNFIGNVESKDILTGRVDVIVCDGFVGNVILKFAESTSQAIFTLLKEELNRNTLSRMGAMILSPTFANLRKRIDYDEYGGALLLGVMGICVKAHGRAHAKAIKNAIRVAAESVKENIVENILKVGRG